MPPCVSWISGRPTRLPSGSQPRVYVSGHAPLGAPNRSCMYFLPLGRAPYFAKMTESFYWWVDMDRAPFGGEFARA